MVGNAIAAGPSEFLRPMPKWTYPCPSTDQPDSAIESSADKRLALLAEFAFLDVETPSDWPACDEDVGPLLLSRPAWNVEMAIAPTAISPASIAVTSVSFSNKPPKVRVLLLPGLRLGACVPAAIWAWSTCPSVPEDALSFPGRDEPASTSAISVAE